MNLTYQNFPQGWVPAQDAINGDPQALLRMDNLRLDKDGIVSLVDGMQLATASFSDFVSALYSKIVGGTEYIWAATGYTSATVTRTSGFFGGTSLIVAGGGSPNGPASFCDALGFVICTAGNLRTKDPVLSAPKPLGIVTPASPLVSLNSQATITIPCPDTIVKGSGTSPEMTVDASTFEGQMATGSSLGIDTTAIGGVPATDIGLDIIQFPFTVVDKPSDVITRVEVDFILDGNPADPPTYENFYKVILDGEWLPVGENTQGLVQFLRSNAVRIGADQTLDWTNIIGVRFLVTATGSVTVKFGDITLIGGQSSGLNGTYEYVQVDVGLNGGKYLSKSPASALGHNTDNETQFYLINGSARLRPVSPNAAFVDEHWWYRRSAPGVVGVNTVTGQPLIQSVLQQFYFVGKSDIGADFTDSLSDIEVLQLNADGSLLPNMFLQTLNTTDLVNGLQDPIYGIEGLYNGRMLYMGIGNIYLSDPLNPDGIDTRFTLKPGGDSTEKNLWIKKLTNDLLILGTTKDLYEIHGTLQTQPDGSIDARIVSMGEKYPPLCSDVVNFGGALFYVAADGLRSTSGQNSINISPQLRSLFKNIIFGTGQAAPISSHGVPGVAIYGDNQVPYSIAAAHGNLYFIVPLQDGTRRIIVYDTVLKTYSLRFFDPVKLYTTSAGELLAAFGASGSNVVYTIDAISGYGVSGNANIPFKLRTVFSSNGQPRNRKDTFTLKIVFDSGGANVSIDIQKDGIGVTELDETGWVNLGQTSATGLTTRYFNVSAANITLGFRYAIQISSVGDGAKTFKLYECTLEYEPRPEQLNHLRILPTNMGTISRKRWTAYAFVVDTLGNNITFTPYLDNVAWSIPDIVQTGTKLTFIYYFKSEAIATDMGGILTGGVFEFYGLNLEECISEKLPPPVKYLIIPADNYGTPNRKRHTSYKFQLLTRGADVQFTPVLDGVSNTVAVFNTTFKQTVEYFFPEGDIIGIDIGGILETLEDTPFEYYGNVRPQTLEILPDRLKYLRLPNTNFGIAAPKRIRTIPFILDTYGQSVDYTPIVDGVLGTTKALSGDGKRTVYYYFDTDSFGTDYGGIIDGNDNIFELYQMLRPADVEVLPVPKVFDQLGPFRFDKIGKLFGFRIRLIATGSTNSIPWAIYDDASPTYNANASPLANGDIETFPGYDNVYEVQFVKNVNLTLGRLVIGPTDDPFFRYDVKIKVQESGMLGESKWQAIR